MKFVSSNIFIMIMISSNNFSNICVIYSFLAKLLTLGILFLYCSYCSYCISTVRAAVVPQLVILDTLFLTSFISPLRAAVVAKLAILGISFLT